MNALVPRVTVKHHPSCPTHLRGHRHLEMNGELGLANWTYVSETYLRIFPLSELIAVGVRGDKGGQFYRFLIGHMLEEDEEYAYFNVPQPHYHLIMDTIVRNCIHWSSVHEIIWRVWRANDRQGTWHFDIYYRDATLELPKDVAKLANSLAHLGDKTMCHKVMDKIDYMAKPYNLWVVTRTDAAVRYIKRYSIPRIAHRPNKEEYIEWFKAYAKMSEAEAETAYKHRAEVGLP